MPIIYMNEIFIEIKDYPNYEVSNMGNVRNKKTKRILKTFKTNAGYKMTRVINKDFKNKKYAIHRLVALHFIENPNNKLQIDHINRDKLDNRKENLRWVSPKENSKNRGIETKPRKKNKLSQHHICLYNNCYVVRIKKNENKICKSFKSLDEAIKFRDEKIISLNNII